MSLHAGKGGGGGGQASSVANAVTFDNSGSGAVSGTTYNGSAAKTVSTNTIGALKASNNLSDVTAATARTNLGLGTAATQSTGTFLQSANNLSDVASLNTTARNLQGGYVLGQSAVAVVNTGNTTENTLATITIPAGAMGANGRIEIVADFSSVSGTSTKTLRFRLGGTATASPTVANTSLTGQVRETISNRNATGSQRWSATNVTGNNAIAPTSGTAAIDTTASVDLTITVQLATAGDSVTLESYQVILYPKA